MAKYFFSFTDGDDVSDDREGCDLPSPGAARSELLKVLTEVYVHEPRDVDHRHVTCDVRDDRGAVVYRASLTLAVVRNPSS